MASFTIEVDESASDLQVLRDEHYDLAIAKNIQTERDPARPPNTIFRTTQDPTGGGLAAQNSFTWVEKYALNYTTTIPTFGAPVAVDGQWHPVAENDECNIDESGNWAVVNSGMGGGFLVTNFYRPVYIVVGILTDGTYQPMWYDKSQLEVKTSNRYFPTNQIFLWFERNPISGFVISELPPTTMSDMLKAGDGEHYYHYDATNSVWSVQIAPLTLC